MYNAYKIMVIQTQSKKPLRKDPEILGTIGGKTFLDYECNNQLFKLQN
jgi:hypothetical protein